ncbi:MAG TPA: hypothetical protein VH643_18465 [Gemmataceae bacterium]|jgi:RNA polymerase sigma factor (sigma-70 family)
MSDIRRTHDNERVLEIIAKLVRKEVLSEAERADLEAAFTPVIRSVVARTVWRRGLSHGAYWAMLEDAVQESWLITWRDILPYFDRERGNPFGFVRGCLRRRLLNWLERGQAKRFHLLADPNAVPDNRTVASESLARTDELRALAERLLRAANFRDKAIFWLRMRGASYAEIASEMGMSEVAVRGVVFRIVSRGRAMEERAEA